MKLCPIRTFLRRENMQIDVIRFPFSSFLFPSINRGAPPPNEETWEKRKHPPKKGKKRYKKETSSSQGFPCRYLPVHMIKLEETKTKTKTKTKNKKQKNKKTKTKKQKQKQNPISPE